MGIAQKTWAEILAKDPCPYCGKKMRCGLTYSDRPTRDHIVPKWTGAILEYDNLAVCCGNCNFLKNDKSLLHFISNIEFEKEYYHYPENINLKRLEKEDVKFLILKLNWKDKNATRGLQANL